MEKFRENLRVRKERAILVGVVRKQSGISNDLMELKALSESAGAVVVDRFIQQISRVNPSTYIGKGKAEQLAGRVKRYRADVIIFDNDLSPGQIRDLEKIVETKVLDRSELILDIFATRAKTKQAKLQVSLAQLEYTYPRLTRMWSHLDSVAGAGGATAAGAVGGIGTRGTGEQQLEIDRRLVNKRISELKKDLANIDKRKIREIKGREGKFTICLVGYTNAGKSTLLNKLTGSDVFVEDRLFATLDTRTKKWILRKGLDVLLSDTVGFVSHLPHQLIASFKATLEEAVNADLLLHVIDVSNADAIGQIESVREVLGEIDCGEKDVIEVFNKADVIDDISLFETLETMYPEAVTISAKSGLGLEKLTDAVKDKYKGGEMLLRVKSLQSNGKIHNFLRAYGSVEKEEYVEHHVVTAVRLGQRQLAMLKKLKPQGIEVVED